VDDSISKEEIAEYLRKDWGEELDVDAVAKLIEPIINADDATRERIRNVLDEFFCVECGMKYAIPGGRCYCTRDD